MVWSLYSLFYSTVLIIKIVFISILGMIIAEICGYTRSDRKTNTYLKRLEYYGIRRRSAPVSPQQNRYQNSTIDNDKAEHFTRARTNTTTSLDSTTDFVVGATPSTLPDPFGATLRLSAGLGLANPTPAPLSHTQPSTHPTTFRPHPRPPLKHSNKLDHQLHSLHTSPHPGTGLRPNIPQTTHHPLQDLPSCSLDEAADQDLALGVDIVEFLDRQRAECFEWERE